ncbi:urease accessory protein UreF [Streptomyces chlorus]|uniref:Urease accessory protein UreF n=1 Tax=Streptomyces chlorus TaxID=887452 RepID=A0ABW1E0T8_9ACTN
MSCSLAMLALADARFPGGGHVHSGGVEEAVRRGLVTGPEDLREFLFGRLQGAGRVAAVFAAAAAHAADAGADGRHWQRLDSEIDARTPSPAQREASRAQGRGTARAGRVAWPSAALDALLAVSTRPHHPAVIGALMGGARAGTPREAAAVAAYLSISGPASAAVRLLGLDPFAANASVAALGPDLERITEYAASVAGHDPAALPAMGAPALDLLAQAHQRHHRDEVRLFAS